MPATWNAQFRTRDIYLLYAFEDVMFRWDHVARTVHMRFIGDRHETRVPNDQRLWNDAICFGHEIDAATYHAGMPGWLN